MSVPFRPVSIGDQIVAFKFHIAQRVKVRDIDRPGIITGMMIERDCQTYRVAYFNNGDRKSEWLYEEEIQAL